MSETGSKSLSHRSLIPMIIGICTLVGCGAPEDGLARQTEQYQVIDEGSVSGVTSTIHAPGDLVPISAPTPELTATNLDMTTAFTILDPSVTTADPGGFDPTTVGTVAQPPAADPRATPVRTTNPSVERPASTPAPTPRRTSTPTPTPAPTLVPSPTPAATPSPTQTPIEEPPPSPPPVEAPPEPEPTPPESQPGGLRMS